MVLLGRSRRGAAPPDHRVAWIAGTWCWGTACTLPLPAPSVRKGVFRRSMLTVAQGAK